MVTNRLKELRLDKDLKQQTRRDLSRGLSAKVTNLYKN